MLSFLIKILAVISIILLVLLGIVVFIILIILFVPITYRIQGQITENKKEAAAKVSWLFRTVRFKLNYSHSLSYQLKLLWFDLTGLIKKKSKDTPGSDKSETAANNRSPEPGTAPEDVLTAGEVPSVEDAPTAEEVPTIEDVPTAEEMPIIEDIPTAEEVPTIEDVPTAEDLEDKPASEEIPAAKAPTQAERTEEFISEQKNEQHKKSLSDKIKDLIFKIKSICAKIKDIWNNISYYINLLQEDATKYLISHCLKVVGNIFKSIRPRKLKADAIIGFDSPDTTGKVYGLLCMLYPYYGDDIHITPDFENKIIEGKVYCKGRIYIYVLAINTLRILFDKKFYKVIHKLKNGGKRNGR